LTRRKPTIQTIADAFPICAGLIGLFAVVVFLLAKWLSKLFKNLESDQVRRRLAVIPIVFALPFVFCGASAWSLCDYQGYELGDLVYNLGVPLTLIVLKIKVFIGRSLTCSDHQWAIPLISSLFIIQWVIWGQLLALLIRMIRAREGNDQFKSIVNKS
jgi:hypothetical protein